jgi:hypothetical protein
VGFVMALANSIGQARQKPAPSEETKVRTFGPRIFPALPKICTLSDHSYENSVPEGLCTCIISLLQIDIDRSQVVI